MATESAWLRFRRWRRSRPFWGGLFLLVSGLELFLSANMTLGDLQVHFGQEGYLSYLLPAILILCGSLTWGTPGQRLFYGILGLLTALFSFLGLNLGGFGLGMLIGILGGALVVSWGPPKARPPASTPPSDTSSDASADSEADSDSDSDSTAESPAEPDRDRATSILPGFPADEPEPRPSADRGTHRKLLAITLVPLTLTAAVLAAGSRTPARADDDCPKGVPSRSATATSDTAAEKQLAKKGAAATSAPTKAPATTQPAATTTPPAPPPAPAPTAAPTDDAAATTAEDETGNPIVDGWNDLVDGVGDLLGIGDEETPSPSATPSATPEPSATPTATPAPTAPGSSGPSATPSGPGSASPSATPTPADVPCLGPRVFKKATGGVLPNVSIRGGLLEGKSLNMYNSTYDGTVELPTANGTVTALKFSMDKSVTEPFSLTIPEPGGQDTVITSDKLTTEDNVEFYTPNFTGKLYGVIPVTFTPESPPPLLNLPWLYFSDVKIDLALVTCDVLQASPLKIISHS